MKEIYKLDPDDPILRNSGEIVLTLSDTILTKLKLARPNKPFVVQSEIRLHFTINYEWQKDVLNWARDFYRKAFWVKFSGKQVEFKVTEESDPAQPQLAVQAPVPAPEQSAPEPTPEKKKKAKSRAALAGK